MFYNKYSIGTHHKSNIPNYDDIRQEIGFKNVSLGNVLNAKAAGEKVTFISQQDLPLFEKYRGEAFEVQVGLHELLGHGSGKLLAEEIAGKFNFDKASPPISPINKQPITTWYKPGETWGSVFKAIAASYEEVSLNDFCCLCIQSTHECIILPLLISVGLKPLLCTWA